MKYCTKHKDKDKEEENIVMVLHWEKWQGIALQKVKLDIHLVPGSRLVHLEAWRRCPLLR